MPLVLDAGRLPRETLEEMARSFREDLAGLEEMISAPKGRVLDPASLETASELLASAVAVLNRPGERTTAALAEEVNLAYATMLAVIDLVKSHTDVPRVPPPRPAKP